MFMLHSGRQEIWICKILVISITAILVFGCKDNSISNSSEESEYLADYEAPAARWGFVDHTGNLVIKPVFDDVSPFSQGLAAVSKGGRWGYSNTHGELVIPPRYRSASAFRNNRARVTGFDDIAGYILPDGSLLCSDDWKAHGDFSDQRAVVARGELFGFINSAGQIVIEPVYRTARNFNSGIAIVGNGELVGAIDTAGREILPVSFDRLKHASAKGLILAQRGDTAIVFNSSGEIIFSESPARFIDTDGKIVALRSGEAARLTYLLQEEADKSFHASNSLLWRDFLYLGENRWAGQTDNGFFLLDSSGQPISETVYDQINLFQDGIAVCSRASHWGYIDTTGRPLTPFIFGLAWDFKEGFARAAFPEGIAFINRTMEIPFYPPDRTTDMRDFSEGLAPVQMMR